MLKSLRNLAPLICATCCVFAARGAAFAEDKRPQTVGGVERLDPALDALVPPDAKMEVIGEGFAWCEGPVWVPAGQFLLFSDIPHNAIVRWDAKSGCKPYLKPSGYTGKDARGGESGSNGLVLDRKGRLILCQHGDRRVARLESPWDSPEPPKYVTLADRYEGKRLNSPNDAVADLRGNIYFTDPPYGLEKGMDDPKKELPFQGVYRIGPEGKLTLLVTEMERPNGIALSPDEKFLYVANSYEKRPVIMMYQLRDMGNIGKSRVFYNARDLAGKPGACDGMTVDAQGNVFATIPGGVGIFTPNGKQLGLLATGDRTANCEFGGDDGSTLFIAANHRVLRIKTSTKGIGL